MRGAVRATLVLALTAFVSCSDCPLVDDHARYEPIVAKIRRLELKPGEQRRYRLDKPGDAATLRLDAETAPERLQGAGTIWVERDEHGYLLIAVETKDQGHAGEWGYLYADRGVPLSRGQSIEGPGREWTLDCDLGNGWWGISYRLG